MTKRMFLIPLENNTYEVARDFYFIGICIPEGYTTNGADIPRIFWSIYPPFKPKYLKAIVLHDYLCDEAKSGQDYKHADSCLKLGLKTLGANLFTQWAFYLGCRAYHLLKGSGR